MHAIKINIWHIYDMSIKSILEYDSDQAKEFFLQNSQYSNLELPGYYDFSKVLYEVDKLLNIDEFKAEYPSKKFENVNYSILTNKDGRYSWRRIELIHPILYVDMVNIITQKNNWNKIKTRVAELIEMAPKIDGSSGWPRTTYNGVKQKAQQVSNWYEKIEQKSLMIGLNYAFLVKADITNCYGTIYTHSIPWALHTKSRAKKYRNNKLFGNRIDNCIQAMQFGETKGIPQGSVLMDFIAELVMADIDAEIADRLNYISDYQILRYRDDYRIFVNNQTDGRKVLKEITLVLADRGMQINESKTLETDDLVGGSLKQDKLDILNLPLFAVKMQSTHDSSELTTINTLQNTLLQVYNFSLVHPNSGALVRVFQDIRERLITTKIHKNSIIPSTAILANMLERNPRLIPIVIPLIGDLTKELSRKDKLEVVTKLINKLKIIPNTGYLDIFLQGMTYTTLKKQSYDEMLTKIVQKSSRQKKLWNNQWINNKALCTSIENTSIIDLNKLKQTKWSSPASETALFAKTYRNS